MMERRDFIKKGCSLCMLIGAGLMIETLSSCSSLPIYKTEIQNSTITIPSSLFETGELQIIRVKSLGYDVALRKQQGNEYTALLLQCTHADNELSSTGNGFICSIHGSRFDENGHVTEGPASIPLKQYQTKVIDTELHIIIS
jgi:nitrite reductase/ring-hydroxylating ferredoxin subunit